MCGIAGLYTKTERLRSELGAQLAGMLEQLSFRGPDSAGVAFYGDPAPEGWCKVSLHSAAADPPWHALADELRAAYGEASGPSIRATHATYLIDADPDQVQEWLAERHPELTLMSAGST